MNALQPYADDCQKAILRGKPYAEALAVAAAKAAAAGVAPAGRAKAGIAWLTFGAPPAGALAGRQAPPSVTCDTTLDAA